MLGITTTNARVGGFRGGILADSKTIYNRIIADGGVSNLTRLNFFVKGLKAIYGDLANVPVCYDAHWIGYKLGSGTGATAGQAAAKLYSLTVAGDAVQATAASQPLLLAHNGASSDNYWWGSGVSGNFVSTPNAVANQITGDIDIIAKVLYNNNGSTQFIVSKTQTALSNHGYDFAVENTNTLYYQQSRAGTFDARSSSVGIGASFNGWVRMTRVSSTGVVTFYTSTDGSTWVQLGATFVLFTGALNNPIADVKIGAYFNSNNVFNGKIYRATISNSIGGSPVVDFNPASYNASTSQTAWTSSTGEVWTINTGTATTGYKGVLVDRTMVQTDGTDDFMTSSTITSISNRTNYLGVITWVTVNANYFMDGNLIASNGILTSTQPGIGIINGGTAYAIYTQQRKLSTTKLSGTTLGASINNGTETTGTSVVPLSFTSVVLGRAGNGVGNINAVLLTIAISNSADDTTNRTAMYNLIRSLNNNSF